MSDTRRMKVHHNKLNYVEKAVLVGHTEWEMAARRWLLTEKMDCYELIDPNLSEGTHSDQ